MTDIDINALVEEWISLAKAKMAIEHDRDSDPEVNLAYHERDAANTRITELETPFNEKIEPIAGRMDGIIDVLKSTYDGETKKIEGDLADVEFKVTKSLVVVNKKSIVAALAANDKIEDGVKSFNLPFLRKMKDIGLLEDDVAEYHEKLSTYVRPHTPIVVDPKEVSQDGSEEDGQTQKE